MNLADELPEDRRSVFRLSYINNLSAKEISELMNMPVRTVENHLYQALRFLRDRIGPACFVLLVLLFPNFL